MVLYSRETTLILVADQL